MGEIMVETMAETMAAMAGVPLTVGKGCQHSSGDEPPMKIKRT